MSSGWRSTRSRRWTLSEFLDSNPLDFTESPNRAIADALKVDHRTIDRDRGENAPPDAQKAQQNGGGAGANAPPGAGDGRRDIAAKAAGGGGKDKGKRRRVRRKPQGREG